MGWSDARIATQYASVLMVECERFPVEVFDWSVSIDRGSVRLVVTAIDTSRSVRGESTIEFLREMDRSQRLDWHAARTVDRLAGQFGPPMVRP